MFLDLSVLSSAQIIVFWYLDRRTDSGFRDMITASRCHVINRLPTGTLWHRGIYIEQIKFKNWHFLLGNAQSTAAILVTRMISGKQLLIMQKRSSIGNLPSLTLCKSGPGSSVGIATDKGLDCPWSYQSALSSATLRVCVFRSCIRTNQ